MKIGESRYRRLFPTCTLNHIPGMAAHYQFYRAAEPKLLSIGTGATRAFIAIVLRSF